MKLATVAMPVVALLAGCCTPPNGQLWKPEAALLELCDPRGPELTGGDGKTVVLWGVAMRKEYETCAARHQRLVEAIPKGD